MSELVRTSLMVFGSTAFIAALLLYFIAQKFKSEANIVTEKIKEILPQANCGGCGKAGCSAFAEACSQASQEDFSSLYCPVGGNAVMQKIATILNFKVEQKRKQFAVVCCQGSFEKSTKKAEYEGIKSCRLVSLSASGEGLCPNGCLHQGDCVEACKFGAIIIDQTTGLPVVDKEKCVACGACVKACPRQLIELKSFDENEKLLYIACKNTQTGAQALKNCKAACIACGKCTKICSSIAIENNLAKVVDMTEAAVLGEQLRECCPNQVITFVSRGKEDEAK